MQPESTSRHDRRWQRAWRYIQADQTVPARAALESMLASAPEDARARLWLAAVSCSEDRPRDAVDQLHAIRGMDALDVQGLLHLVQLAMRIGDEQSAARVLQEPRLAATLDPATLLAVADSWQRLGRMRDAKATLARAEPFCRAQSEWWFYRAMQLSFAGELADARRSLERCVELEPGFGQAILHLVQMDDRKGRPGRLDLIRHALASSDRGPDDHAALLFASYVVQEKAGAYAAAWTALDAANRSLHARLPYDHSARKVRLEALLHACDARFIGMSADRPPLPGPQPIFVVGLPRSGTTVLERMLGNHSEVASAGELRGFRYAISVSINHFISQDFPDADTLDKLSGTDWDQVAYRYLEQTQWRACGKPYYVDKLPSNWMLAGLIHKAFPNAPILHIARSPMDVCFSNLRAYFGPDPVHAYAYDQHTLVQHHHLYRELMAHWRRAMPNVIVDVDYDRLVADPEAVSREVLAACKLPYEPGCTDLRRNQSISATLSMAQVREGIRKDMGGRWVPYAAQLGVLRAVIDAACA